MLKDILKYAISIAGLALLIFLGMQLSRHIISERRADIDKNKCSTNCFVERTGHMKGYYGVFVAYINGQKVSFKQNIPFRQMEDGEVFTLEYKCDDPEQREVLFYRPHFLADDDFNLTKGKIIRTIPLNCVEFSYMVDDSLYSRLQKVKSYDSLDMNKIYTVGYLKSNPRRAIIKFR